MKQTIHTTNHSGEDLPCPHQFFEIKKMCEYTKNSIPKRQGVLVKCALCPETRELWESEET